MKGGVDEQAHVVQDEGAVDVDADAASVALELPSIKAAGGRQADVAAAVSLLRRVRDGGLRIAIASSAKKDELEKYLDIARITNLVDVTTSSDDAEESKPAPDIFEIVLRKLKIEGADAVAIGDTPYDAEAAVKAKIATIGVLCGGFLESSLRQGGCIEIYPGPATLFARFADSPLAR